MRPSRPEAPKSGTAMRRAIRFAVAAATVGRRQQSFLDAAWVGGLLRVAPGFMKNRVALELLALSPHYFYRKEQAGASHSEFLAAEAERNRSSRRLICESILAHHLSPGWKVVDYGCGPGYLAGMVAEKVGHVYAVDVSRGVLSCAKVLNGNSAITYLDVDGFESLPDNSIDFAYSFAVVQHLSEAVFESVLGTLFRKLKKGGRILLDVVVDQPGWKTEGEWRSDTTVLGKAKLKLGLNCFNRSIESVRLQALSAGFEDVSIRSTSELVENRFDDICDQALLGAVKG